MSQLSGRKFLDLEEEKRSFDRNLQNIEKQVSQNFDLQNSQNKKQDDEQKSGYELIEQSLYIELDLELAESASMSKMERRKEFINNSHQLQDKKLRTWLLKRGKGFLLDFQDEQDFITIQTACFRQIKKLKECFNSLDGDGSGSIGIEELEEPLIGLGFADNREEVQEMINAVDEDKSGMIEFHEFLTIIKNSDGNEKTAKINKFFKDMTSGQFSKNDMSFNLLVQKLRREYLVNAIMSNDQEKKAFGEKILRNVSKQLQSQKLNKKVL